jgi:hypothetical protein
MDSEQQAKDGSYRNIPRMGFSTTKKQDGIGKSLTSTNVCPNAASINLSCKRKSRRPSGQYETTTYTREFSERKVTVQDNLNS